MIEWTLFLTVEAEAMMAVVELDDFATRRDDFDEIVIFPTVVRVDATADAEVDAKVAVEVADYAARLDAIVK